MDGTVIFSRDGILRFRSNSKESVAVPLELIQDTLGQAPYPFFLQQSRKSFVLESGSTIGSFLLCLSPWAQVVSDMTDRKIQAYIDEIRKPSADAPVFDRCEVRKYISFSREMYHEPMPADVDFMEWLNRPRGPVEWTELWEASTDYNICGYINGDTANYSMSTSIHELKNVPLVINRTPIIMASGRDDQGTPLLSAETPGVQLSPTDAESKSTHKLFYAKATPDEDMTVEDLLRVVIEDGLWFDSPMGAINMRARLDEACEAMGLGGEDHQDEDEPQDAGELDQTDKPLTVSVAPGAFDSLVSHAEEEKSEWDMLMDNMQPTGRLSYRIGKIEEDVPQDDRARGKIFK